MSVEIHVTKLFHTNKPQETQEIHTTRKEDYLYTYRIKYQTFKLGSLNAMLIEYWLLLCRLYLLF